MATHKIALSPFNNLSLVVGDQYNLVSAVKGHFYFSILNVGAGNVAISNANTVATSDPASYDLPPNLSLSPLAYGPDGVWVACGAGGGAAISVALVPR